MKALSELEETHSNKIKEQSLYKKEYARAQEELFRANLVLQVTLEDCVVE